MRLNHASYVPWVALIGLLVWGIGAGTSRRVLRVHGVQIVDDAGTVRGFMGVDPAGTTRLQLMSANGETAVSVAVRDGVPTLTMQGPDGPMILVSRHRERNVLVMPDRAGGARIALTVDASGSPEVVLRDSESTRIAADIGADGLARLRVTGSEGAVELTAREDPGVVILDHEGNVIAELP